MKVTIIGANTLIGIHLLRELNEHSFSSIATWNYGDSEDALTNALDTSKIVFNMHEYQDYSLVPDNLKLKKHNVEFINLLLEKCRAVGVLVLVQHSSVYLQSSYWWPNVNGRECDDYGKFGTKPFREYCDTKFCAENIIKNSEICSIIMRVGPVYGEDDHQSLVCDAIAMTKHMNPLPIIGDNKGVLQFTYAGNVADAMIKCAKSMLQSIEFGQIDSDFQNSPIVKLKKSELLVIRDQTPLKGINDLFQMLLADKDGTKPLDDQKQPYYISFIMLFPFYLLLCSLIWILNGKISTIFDKFPSPSYFYMVFHHWTFFCDFKLRVIFNWSPKYSWLDSLHRSREYYKRIGPQDIVSHSWVSTLPENATK